MENKPEQYKQCMTHIEDMFPYWYNSFRKHINGSLGVTTEYYDRKTASNVFHVACPDRDISLLLLDCNKMMDIASKVEGCVLPNVLTEIYLSVRREYEKNKTK